jgi:hypothetical protein
MPEFRQLAPNVHAFLQPPLIWYSSAGVIVGERGVIVVDSLANAAMTEGLRAEIRRVTDKPIRFLINTHSHADHVYTPRQPQPPDRPAGHGNRGQAGAGPARRELRAELSLAPLPRSARPHPAMRLAA